MPSGANMQDTDGGGPVEFQASQGDIVTPCFKSKPA